MLRDSTLHVLYEEVQACTVVLSSTESPIGLHQGLCPSEYCFALQSTLQLMGFNDCHFVPQEGVLMSNMGQFYSRLDQTILLTLPLRHLFLSLLGFGEPRLGHDLRKGLRKPALAQSRNPWSEQKKSLRLNPGVAHLTRSLKRVRTKL